MVTARLIESGEVVEEREWDDPQDALTWLWDRAEQGDHDRGPLSGEIDGGKVSF